MLASMPASSIDLDIAQIGASVQGGPGAARPTLTWAKITRVCRILQGGYRTSRLAALARIAKAPGTWKIGSLPSGVDSNGNRSS
jgi:hypothetical protein